MFWDTTLKPVLGEAVPWLVIFGVPALVWVISNKISTWRDRRRNW